MVPLRRVRVLVDYRPALRARTGLGEYVHELAGALQRTDPAPDLTVFTASWRDRLTAATARAWPRARVVDRRLPVGLLRWAWHHTGWPPIEWLAGPHDVVHSPTPLRLPARRAAQVVTIFDLHFLRHPEQATDVAQRDFARRVRDDVVRADHVIAGSAQAAAAVTAEFGLAADRVTITPLGAPSWADDVRTARAGRPGTSILFLGTLEPRKNVGLLLDAYERLRRRRPDAPPLIVAGAPGAGADLWRHRATTPPLAGHVTLPGYVTEADRRQLLTDARVLALPSLDEGFGLPALEAMACGVPVVVSPAGALPELVGDAGFVVPLGAPDAWATALEACLDDTRAAEAAARGTTRARQFSWAATAAATMGAYRAAMAVRRERRR